MKCKNQQLCLVEFSIEIELNRGAAPMKGVDMPRSPPAPFVLVGLMAGRKFPAAPSATSTCARARRIMPWTIRPWHRRDRSGARCQCRVRGVAGLRVWDASILPRIPSFHIVAPVVMTGETIAADNLASA
jgi:hypothetical protein